MKNILIIIIGLFTIIKLNGQQLNDYKITDFFKIIFYEKDDNTYGFYDTPDSLLGTAFEDYGKNMWAMNTYFISMFSKFYEIRSDWYKNSYNPDTNEVKKVFNKILCNDSIFNKIFFISYNKIPVPDIHIDNLQIIASRFYYLHRLRSGKIATHVCVGVNEVLKLKQNEASPFYNAFCYSVVRSLDTEGWNEMQNLIIKTSEIDPEISDEELNKLKLQNYDKLSTSEIYRKLILKQYEKNKDYLNFKIIVD